MIEQDFESLARSISEGNQRARAEAHSRSARLASVLISSNPEKLDEFNSELADELHGLLEGSREDPTTGGTGSSATHASDSQGQPAEH